MNMMVILASTGIKRHKLSAARGRYRVDLALQCPGPFSDDTRTGVVRSGQRRVDDVCWGGNVAVDDLNTSLAGAVRKSCIKPGRRRLQWLTGRVVLIVIAAVLGASLAAGSGNVSAPAAGSVLGKAMRVANAEWRASAEAPSASARVRYVALGDSVPYGHELANPGKDWHDGLAPDQGPSAQAWPSLVDAWLPGLAPLTLRPTSCALTGPQGRHYDQLAISGAPTEVNRWTGLNTDCHYTGAVPVHTAVVPDEIGTANLWADPPGLVTIQAGADDLNFDGCLKALLGLPSQLGADNCVTHTKSGYLLTAKAIAELKSVKTGLRAAIHDILAAAPHAQILLVDYYQIIPSASEPVVGTSALCLGLQLDAHNGRLRPLREQADYVQVQLNDAIKAAAAGDPNVAVVDIAGTFSGHEMCTSNAWVFDAGVLSNWRAAHPKASGQIAIAHAVVAFCKKLAAHCLGHPAPHGWAATKAPLPAGAATKPSALIDYEACPAATACVATGTYTDSAGHTQVLLLTGARSSWKAMRAPLPANAAADPQPSLFAMSCASAASCVVGGYYHDSQGIEDGLLLTGSGSSWTAAQIPLPANAVTSLAPIVTGAACESGGVCVASTTGYLDSTGNDQAMLLVGSGTSWTADEAPLPANAAKNANPFLSVAGCGSTACVAGGSYTDSSGKDHGVLLTRSGSSWTAAEALMPSGATTGPTFTAATCPSAAVCVLAGYYYDAAGNSPGLLITGSGSSWKVMKAPLPANAAAGHSAQIQSLACESATTCVAVGSYTDSAGRSQGMLLIGSGTSWTAREAPVPANGAAGADSSLAAVACPSRSACVAAGTYTGRSTGYGEGMLITGSGSSWTAVESPLPAGASVSADGIPSAVTCASTTACGAAGSYYTSPVASSQGLLLSGPV
jgi:hypothetical protein